MLDSRHSKTAVYSLYTIFVDSTPALLSLRRREEESRLRLIWEAEVNTERRIDEPLEGVLLSEFVCVLGDGSHILIIDLDQAGAVLFNT